jgi:hypothetical protein
MEVLGRILIFGSLLVAVGCSKPNSIVGTWGYDRSPAGIDAALQFNRDGTYREWFKGGSTNSHGEGTYQLVGETLRITRMRAVMATGATTSQPKTWESKVRWLSPEIIEITTPNETLSYTRRSK